MTLYIIVTIKNNKQIYGVTYNICIYENRPCQGSSQNEKEI